MAEERHTHDAPKLEGCADNSCIFVKPAVGTNGGCRCINRSMSTVEVLRLKRNIRRLQQPITATSDLLEVAKGYEKWEGDLVMEGDWSNGLPVITQPFYDRLMELQALRNAALQKAGGV